MCLYIDVAWPLSVAMDVPGFSPSNNCRAAVLGPADCGENLTSISHVEPAVSGGGEHMSDAIVQLSVFIEDLITAWMPTDAGLAFVTVNFTAWL
jgi:hypothetical protein